MPSVKSPAPWINVGKAAQPDDDKARVCRFCGARAECSVRIASKGDGAYMPACRPCQHAEEGPEVEE